MCLSEECCAVPKRSYTSTVVPISLGGWKDDQEIDLEAQGQARAMKFLELPLLKSQRPTISKNPSAPINKSNRDLTGGLALSAGRKAMPEALNVEGSSQQSTSGFSPPILDRAGFDLKFSSCNKSLSLTDLD